MKKFIFFVLISFTLLSCQENKIMDDNKAKIVIGKWRIYETIQFQNNDDSVDTKCTTCPQVEFFKNHSGFIKSADARLSYFNWDIENESIAIKHKDDSQTDSTINDGRYNLTFDDKVAIKEIILLDTVKNIKYVLSK
jgi:hypothetical protein